MHTNHIHMWSLPFAHWFKHCQVFAPSRFHTVRLCGRRVLLFTVNRKKAGRTHCSVYQVHSHKAKSALCKRWFKSVSEMVCLCMCMCESLVQMSVCPFVCNVCRSVPGRASNTMRRRWDAFKEYVRAMSIKVFMIFIYLNIFIRVKPIEDGGLMTCKQIVIPSVLFCLKFIPVYSVVGVFQEHHGLLAKEILIFYS